jgi:hypothetical protein
MVDRPAAAVVSEVRPGLLAAVPPAQLARALEAMLTAALLGSVAYVTLRPIDDPDLWWHLAAGRRILDGGGVPWTDSYSYVAQGNSWIAYSWLAEVIFAGLERAFGPGALIVLAAAVFTATFGIVMRTCQAAGARHLVAFLVTAAAALVAASGRTVRPHLFSFLCMALCSHCLVRDQYQRGGGLWALIPIVALWANTHILFPFAFVLLACRALAGRRAWWGPLPGRRIALVAGAGAATLATPYGWHLIGHLWVMAHQPIALGMVSEFQTPSLHGAVGQLLTGFFFATVLALIFSPVRRDFAEVGSVLGFAFLAYAMTRNVPFFAIVAAPVLARHLDALWPATSAHTTPTRARVLLAAVAVHVMLLGLVGMVVARRATTVWPPGAAVDRNAFPVDAVRYLEKQPPLGRLFNDFNWGGYLIGHLYPRYQVSMDGRTQVYGEETLRDYRALLSLEPGWRVFFDRCDPDVVLWPKDGSFVRVLELLPEWSRLYEDDVAAIFVRRRSGA